MRESVIERAFVHRVEALGGETRKVKWLDRNGAPDRVVLLPGGGLTWVELKAPGGRLSRLQVLEHERLRRLGQRVDVVWTLDAAENWRP